jgi:hypothetical protein
LQPTGFLGTRQQRPAEQGPAREFTVRHPLKDNRGSLPRNEPDISMPFSVSSQLSTIVGLAEQLKPRTVLDVGTGMGQYGFLLRTNLEGLNLFHVNGDQGRQRSRDEWAVTIDGIEGFEGYLTPVHRYAYTRMMIGNALDVLPTLEARRYELVLAVDILEHFSRADAASFITQCQRVCAGTLVVATPKEFLPQDVPANPLENHRSHWSEDDLRQFGFLDFASDDSSVIAVFRQAAGAGAPP